MYIIIFPYIYPYIEKYIYIIYMSKFIIYTTFIIHMFEYSLSADSFSRSGRAVIYFLTGVVDSTGIFDRSR